MGYQPRAQTSAYHPPHESPSTDTMVQFPFTQATTSTAPLQESVLRPLQPYSNQGPEIHPQTSTQNNSRSSSSMSAFAQVSQPPSESRYLNTYPPPFSQSMLQTTRPQDGYSLRPDNHFGDGLNQPGNDRPNHVVGAQGRRGPLPTAPGKAGGSVIPQKNTEGKFPCPHCIKTYLHAKHLKRHLLRHTGDRPYMCVLCRDTFSRSDILKRHFQKCSIRRGNPTGVSHLSHPQAHVKKNQSQSQGPKPPGIIGNESGSMSHVNGLGGLQQPDMSSHFSFVENLNNNDQPHPPPQSGNINRLGNGNGQDPGNVTSASLNPSSRTDSFTSYNGDQNPQIPSYSQGPMPLYGSPASQPHPPQPIDWMFPGSPANTFTSGISHISQPPPVEAKQEHSA